MNEELLSELKKFNRNIEWLKKQSIKDVKWVGPTTITKLTGWNNEGMRRARMKGEVEYKRSKSGGYVYNPQSINEVYLTRLKAV